MIDALALARIEREAARDERALRGPQRVEHRLLQRGRPDVGRERLAVDRDVDALRRLVDLDLDAAGGPGSGSGRRPRRRRISDHMPSA